MAQARTVDSNLPRFSQAVQAVVLALAFVLDARLLVPVVLVVMAAALVGGPRLNLFAYLYRSVPLPRGEPEPAAPPRFAQLLGTVVLTIATVALYASAPGGTVYYALGWGPALLVALLAGIAATTNF